MRDNWTMDYKEHLICGEEHDGKDEDIMAYFDMVTDFGENPSDYATPDDPCDELPDSFAQIGCGSVDDAMMLIDDVVNGTIKNYMDLIASPYAKTIWI